MKTLTNQTLLYDEECPLCQAYTAAFVKTGMLDDNGRKAFCKLSETELEFVDARKAANEIALIDRDKKTVIYGIDSLLKIIGNSFPWIEKTGHCKPVHFGLRKSYSFISYNRKVIIPDNEKRSQELKCIPDFNITYRIAYILFSILITAFVLFEFTKMIPSLPKANFSREIMLAGGQLLFQGLFLMTYNRKKILNYFGNLMTVSMMGVLMLLPLILLKNTIYFPITLVYSWFGIVVLIMFKEHWRRVKLLELPYRLCITWLVYRIIAFLLILNF